MQIKEFTKKDPYLFTPYCIVIKFSEVFFKIQNSSSEDLNAFLAKRKTIYVFIHTAYQKMLTRNY